MDFIYIVLHLVLVSILALIVTVTIYTDYKSKRVEQEKENEFNRDTREKVRERNEMINNELTRTNNRRPKPRCVFSLTTIPSRILTITKTIEGLLKQSIEPDAVIVNVPDSSRREAVRYVIPQALIDLAKKDKRVVINRCGEDIGPATKMVPTLLIETDLNTRIFPVDDDCEFPPKYFEELLLSSINDPNTVYGYHGITIENSTKGKWHLINQHVGDVDVAETVTGVVYRRGMFDLNKLHIPSSDEPCFLADDIWLNAHIAENGYKRRLLLSGPDGISNRGRNGMPMYNNLDAPNPLYIENIFNNNNSKCIRCVSNAFYTPVK